jgi:hypothetical protein
MTTLNFKSIAFIALSVLLTIVLLAGAYYLGARSRSNQDVVPVRDVTSDSVLLRGSRPAPAPRDFLVVS